MRNAENKKRHRAQGKRQGAESKGHGAKGIGLRGCESRLLVIGISWQLEKNKDWSGGVMEYWSGGKE